MPVYGQMHSPYSNYLCHAPNIAAVEPFLMSLVMARCRTDIRDCHLSDDERMRYVLSHGREFYIANNNKKRI